MKERLIIKAFDQATKQRQPKPDLIVHRAGRPGNILVNVFANYWLIGSVGKVWLKRTIPNKTAPADRPMLSLSGWDRPCGRLKAELLEDGCFMNLQVTNPF